MGEQDTKPKTALNTEEALRELIKDTEGDDPDVMADRFVDLIIDLIAERSEEKAEERVDKHERDWDHNRLY